MCVVWCGVDWVGEGEQYRRIAGICQWVGLLPIVDAIGANLMCSPHNAGGNSAFLIPVNRLNCVPFPRQTIATIATIMRKAIPQWVAIFIINAFKSFKFWVDVVVHLCGVGGCRYDSDTLADVHGGVKAGSLPVLKLFFGDSADFVTMEGVATQIPPFTRMYGI